MIDSKVKTISKTSRFIELVSSVGVTIPVIYMLTQMSGPGVFELSMGLLSGSLLYGLLLLNSYKSDKAGPVKNVIDELYKKSITKESKEHLKALGFLKEKSHLTPEELDLVKSLLISYQSASLIFIFNENYKYDYDYKLKSAITSVCSDASHILAIQKYRTKVNFSDDMLCDKVAQTLTNNYKFKINIKHIITIIKSKTNEYQHTCPSENKVLQSPKMLQLLALNCEPWSEKDYKFFLEETQTHYGYNKLVDDASVIQVLDNLNSTQVSFIKLKSMALEIAHYNTNILEHINKKISAQENMQHSSEFVSSLINKKTKLDVKNKLSPPAPDPLLQSLNLSKQSASALKPQWQELIDVYERLNQKLSVPLSDTANESVNQTKLKIDIQGMIPQLMAFERQLLLVENVESRVKMQDNLKLMLEQVTEILKSQSQQLDIELDRQMNVHSKYLYQKK